MVVENRETVINTPGDSSSTSCIRQVSWGAIFAGVVTILSIQFLLSTLGAAIGLSIGGADITGAITEYGIAAAIWWIITAIIAFFIGGWVAGRLGNFKDRMSGLLNGIVCWGFTVIVLGYLVGGAALAGAGAMGAEANGAPPAPQAETAAAAIWGFFIVLLIGVICAGLGGAFGITKDTRSGEVRH